MLRRIYLPGYAYNRFYQNDLWFARPKRGKSYESVTCPACHRPMVCVVRDARSTIRIRLGYGLVALGFLLGLIAAFTAGIDWVVEQDTAWPAMLLVVGCVVAFVVLVRAILYALSYAGVGIQGAIPFIPKRHEIGG